MDGKGGRVLKSKGRPPKILIPKKTEKKGQRAKGKGQRGNKRGKGESKI